MPYEHRPGSPRATRLPHAPIVARPASRYDRLRHRSRSTATGRSGGRDARPTRGSRRGKMMRPPESRRPFLLRSAMALPMMPEEIVSELDKHIVGQDAAKRAVAIALRNRWRRQQVPDPLRQEITPKNILLIGPTGVGKTEIARRLARLADAPFVKVEATKFTEVGYVGRDVDTIVRDLVEVSIK